MRSLTFFNWLYLHCETSVRLVFVMGMTNFTQRIKMQAAEMHLGFEAMLSGLCCMQVCEISLRHCA
jgi:hypothetical protein